MYSGKSIKVNAIFNAILSFSSFIFPLISFPYITRVLNAEHIGKVTFATSVVSYFLMISSLGIPIYGLRMCSKCKNDKIALSKTVSELLFLNLIFFSVSSIIYFFAVFSIPSLREDRMLYLIIGSTLVFNLIGCEWLYSSLEQYKYITIRSLIFKFIALIMMFIFVKRESDYVMYAFLSIFAASASNIINFIYLHKYVNINLFKVNIHNLKAHMKPIIVFFGMTCASTIYTNLDNVQLGILAGSSEVGFYSVSIKIKMVLVSLITSLSAVLLPRVCNYWENNMKNEFYSLGMKACSVVTTLSIPLMLFFSVHADNVILVIAGDSYINSIIPMKIVMGTVFLIPISNVIGTQLLVAMGEEKKVLKAEFIGAIFNLLFNSVLIPKYGASGAATSTLGAELLVTTFIYLDFLRISGKNVLIAINWKAIIISSIFALIFTSIIVFENVFLDLIISCLTFVFFYVLLMTAFKDNDLHKFLMQIKNMLF